MVAVVLLLLFLSMQTEWTPRGAAKQQRSEPRNLKAREVDNTTREAVKEKASRRVQLLPLQHAQRLTDRACADNLRAGSLQRAAGGTLKAINVVLHHLPQHSKLLQRENWELRQHLLDVRRIARQAGANLTGSEAGITFPEVESLLEGNLTAGSREVGANVTELAAGSEAAAVAAGEAVNVTEGIQEGHPAARTHRCAVLCSRTLLAFLVCCADRGPAAAQASTCRAGQEKAACCALEAP